MNRKDWEAEWKRRALPDERAALTQKFEIDGHEGYFTVGLYDNGAPGEIFIVMSKEGSTVSGFADGVAEGMSYMLRSGMPVDTFIKKFRNKRFEPFGIVTHVPGISQASSVVDLIAQWLELKKFPSFVDLEGDAEISDAEPLAKAG